MRSKVAFLFCVAASTSDELPSMTRGSARASCRAVADSPSAVRSGSVGKGLVAVTLALLLTVKARFEEDHLRAAYPAYRDYQARTPRFLPTGRRFRG